MSRSRDFDRSGARARKGLHSHDLVIEVAVAEPVLGPDFEVVGRCNGATGALALAHGPILRKGRGSLSLFSHLISPHTTLSPVMEGWLTL